MLALGWAVDNGPVSRKQAFGWDFKEICFPHFVNCLHFEVAFWGRYHLGSAYLSFTQQKTGFRIGEATSLSFGKVPKGSNAGQSGAARGSPTHMVGGDVCKVLLGTDHLGSVQGGLLSGATPSDSQPARLKSVTW